MNSWHTGPRAAFDLETTGRDPHSARIVTASIVLVDAAGQPLQEREWLVDPGVEIPAEAAAIHGISTERARSEGLPAALATAGIAEALNGYFDAGIPVMAFNAAYDFTVLARECSRYGLPAPAAAPVIDPYVLDKQVDRYRRGKRTLGALCELYGVRLDAAHTSAADALATIGVADALARRYAELCIGAAELHALQIDWCAQQAANFEAWLRRKDPEAVVDGVWPVRLMPAAV